MSWVWCWSPSFGDELWLRDQIWEHGDRVVLGRGAPPFAGVDVVRLGLDRVVERVKGEDRDGRPADLVSVVFGGVVGPPPRPVDGAVRAVLPVEHQLVPVV